MCHTIVIMTKETNKKLNGQNQKKEKGIYKLCIINHLQCMFKWV